NCLPVKRFGEILGMRKVPLTASRHSGTRAARARNPFHHRACGPMDSGPAPRGASRNDDGSPLRHQICQHGALPAAGHLCETWLMDIRQLLKLLVALLVTASLTLAPLATPTAAEHLPSSAGAHMAGGHDMSNMDMADMDMTGMDMTAMPCCPDK